MEFRTILLKSLETRRRRYRRDFNRARAEFSEESIHDLRVATRRLLALLALIHILAPEADLKIIRRQLKAQLDSLDGLRDAQVMLGEVNGHVEELPGLGYFAEDLEERVQKLLGRARRSLGQLNFVAMSNLNARLLGLRDFLSGQLQLGDPLAAADSAYAEVISRYRTVELAAPASFHHLRVAFKKFRYTVEVVQPLVAGLENASLTELSDYQTLLGNVQDAQVFLQAFDRFEGGSDPAITGGDKLSSQVAGDRPEEDETPTSPDSPAEAIQGEQSETVPVKTIHEYYSQRLDTAIAEAYAALGKVETFWRVSPDQPFPWEKPV